MAASLCASPPLATTSAAGTSSTQRPCGLSLPRAAPTLDEEAVATTFLSELAEIATSPQSPLMKAISAWPEFASGVHATRAVSSPEPWLGQFPAHALACFQRGTLLMVGNGQWKSTDDLVQLCAAHGLSTQAGGHARLRLLHATLRHTPEQNSDRVLATFQLLSDGRQLVADCERTHPFLVESKGWAALEPHAGTFRHGETCQQLSPGDVCVPPGALQASQSSQQRTSQLCNGTLSEADSSAAWLLSQLALNSAMNQERHQPAASHNQASSARLLKAKSSSFEKRRPVKSKKCSDGFVGDDPPSKRPMNAFMLFAQRYRQQVTREHPGRDNRAISTILGDHWRQLDHSERIQFVVEARGLAEEHQKLYPNCWKRKRPVQHHDIKRSA